MVCGGTEDRRYSVAGFDVIQVKSAYRNDMGRLRRIASFLSFSFASSLRALRTQPDVIFASSTPLTVAIPGLICKWLLRKPLVFEVRDLWPEVPIRLGYLRNRWLIRAARRLEHAAYRGSEAVVGLSPQMCEGIRRVHPSASVSLIPNTSQIQTFAVSAERAREFRTSRGIPQSSTLISYVGSLGETYDPSWLIRLASASPLRGRDVRVVIVGEGTMMNPLREICREMRLTPNSVLLGPLPKSDIAAVYAASDLVASCLIDAPELAGNSLNKVFDAYAAGRPVIFNHGGWLSKLTTEANAGWRLSSDPEKAASELAMILDGEDLKKARIASADLAVTRFDVSQAAAKLESILQSAVAARP